MTIKIKTNYYMKISSIVS